MVKFNVDVRPRLPLINVHTLFLSSDSSSVVGKVYILIIATTQPGPAPLLLLKYETWKLLFNSRFILHYSSDISVGESILSMPVPPPPLQTAPYQPLSSPQNRTLKTWEMELLSFSTTAKSIDFFLWRKSCIILLLRALVWNLN